MKAFSRDLYADGPSRIIPLDLSNELGISDGPATSPAWRKLHTDPGG